MDETIAATPFGSASAHFTNLAFRRRLVHAAIVSVRAAARIVLGVLRMRRLLRRVGGEGGVAERRKGETERQDEKLQSKDAPSPFPH